MKKGLLSSVFLLVYYIGICAVLICALATLYMIYTLCSSLVAGQVLSFDLQLFLSGLLYFAPLVLVFGALLMVLFFIRHPVSSIIPLIVYCLIYASSWFFVIPQLVRMNISFKEKLVGEREVIKPSAGYFRRMGSAIFYYSSVGEEDSLVSGVGVDTTATNNKVYVFSNLDFSPENGGFSDSLILDTLEMPPALSLLVSRGSLLWTIFNRCASGSFIGWLCFASLGLALLGVCGLRKLSVWRLVNVLFALIATGGIITFNVIGYTNHAFVQMENSLITSMGAVPFIKRISTVGNPLVILGNILAFVILVVIGIVLGGRHRFELAQHAAEEEEFV